MKNCSGSVAVEGNHPSAIGAVVRTVALFFALVVAVLKSKAPRLVTLWWRWTVVVRVDAIKASVSRVVHGRGERVSALKRARTVSLVSKRSTWACVGVRSLRSALCAVHIAGLVVCNEYIEKERIRKT
jgi:hypothetical protein